MSAAQLLRYALSTLAAAAMLFLLGALFAGTASAEESSPPGGPTAPIGPGYSDNHSGVACIQKFLGVAMNGSPYGTFGRATYGAVKAFQADHDLEVDGAVGVETAQAMLDAGMPASCRAAMPTTNHPHPATTKPATQSGGGDESDATATTQSGAGQRSPGQGGTASTGAPSSTTTTSSDDGAPTPKVPNPSIPPADAPSAPAAPAGRDGKKLAGKYADATGCDTDAYTVKSAPMIIEQQRPSATETSIGASGSAEGEAEGTGGAGVAGPAAAAGGKGSAKGKAEGSITGSRRSESTTVETKIGDIEVRYSPSCHTAWTRVSTEDESALSGVAISDGKNRQNRDVHPRPGKGGATKPGNYVSPMIAVGPTTRVLGSLDGNAGGGAKLARDQKPSTGWVTPATVSSN